MVVIALAAATVLLIFVFFILPKLVTPDEVTPSLTNTEQAAPPGNIATDLPACARKIDPHARTNVHRSMTHSAAPLT